MWWLIMQQNSNKHMPPETNVYCYKAPHVCRLAGTHAPGRGEGVEISHGGWWFLTYLFLLLHYGTLILLVPSLKWSFIWNAARSNYRIIWMIILFDSVQHVTISCRSYPSLYAGYIVSDSIREQNGFGPLRSCKIVLLTLAAPRGVTDLYLSWGINIGWTSRRLVQSPC